MAITRQKKSLTSFINLRHKAEDVTAGLPGLLAQAEKAAGSILSGEHVQRKPGTGENFWQFREYDIADRPQDIDWRQSAKGDRVYIRQKEWQTTQTAIIWCQNNENMNYRSKNNLPSKQETGQIISLAMGMLLTQAGEKIRHFYGTTSEGRTDLSLQRLGEGLLTKTTKALPDIPERQIPQNSTLILAGDFLSPTGYIEESFDLLAERASNVIVIQILDPAELLLPFKGRIIFEESNSSLDYRIDNVDSVRDEYKKRIGNHLDDIKKLCKKHRWGWLLHSTDEDIRQTLFDAWLMMAPESFHAGGNT